MNQDRAARIGLPAQDCKDKTRKAEQKGEDSQKTCNTARIGQLKRDSQNGTGRTRLHGQN
jgi:hypothetical protein